MPKNIIEIETPVGFIRYRDTIFLDKIESDDMDWVFIGEIFNRHVSNNPKTVDPFYYKFKLKFFNVISMFHCDQEETSSGLFSGFHDMHVVPSFFKVENSEYLKKCPFQDKEFHKEYFQQLSHYCLRTYDTAFNIIAKDFEITINSEETTIP